MKIIYFLCLVILCLIHNGCGVSNHPFIAYPIAYTAIAVENIAEDAFAYKSSYCLSQWEVNKVCDNRDISPLSNQLYADGFLVTKTEMFFENRPVYIHEKAFEVGNKWDWTVKYAISEYLSQINPTSLLVNENFTFFEIHEDVFLSNLPLHEGWIHKDRISERDKKQFLNRIKGQGKYLQFYIANTGDLNCDPSFSYVNKYKSLDPWQKRDLRLRGFYPDHCIAAKRVLTPKSTYGIILKHEVDKHDKSIAWGLVELKDLNTNTNHLSSGYFNYCCNNDFEDNVCNGRMYSFKCNKTNIVDNIYPEPNPVLPNFQTHSIREPLHFQGNKVIASLDKVLEKKYGKLSLQDQNRNMEIDRELDDADLSERYDNIDTEGLAWFDYYYEKNGNSKKWSNDGHQVLKIIREDDQKLLIVDLDTIAGNKNSQKAYLNIDAIPGDGIYCISYDTARALTKGISQFEILKFSWNGQLVKCTIVNFPSPINLIPIDNSISHFFFGLKINNNTYSVSVCEQKKTKRKRFSYKIYKYSVHM